MLCIQTNAYQTVYSVSFFDSLILNQIWLDEAILMKSQGSAWDKILL